MSRDTTRRRERRGAPGLKQLPWRRMRNPYRPVEVMSADQIEAIHEASLRVLEEMGMEFLDAEALSILKAAGAEVTPGSLRVRFDRAMILENVAKAPAEVTLHARNPERNLTFGDNHINFGTVASAREITGNTRRAWPVRLPVYASVAHSTTGARTTPRSVLTSEGRM